jgi:hypothetical protein
VTYRVGNHQPQNVYRDDAYIGVMFTAEDAALVVEALNEREAEDRREVDRANAMFDEWADVRRRIAEQAEHRPYSPGRGGVGYGHCVGCGELWPCAPTDRPIEPEPDEGSVALVKHEAYQRLGDRLWYRASRRAHTGLTWAQLGALGDIEVIHHA